MILQIELDTFRVIYRSRDGLEYERESEITFLRRDDREQRELEYRFAFVYPRSVARLVGRLGHCQA